MVCGATPWPSRRASSSWSRCSSSSRISRRARRVFPPVQLVHGRIVEIIPTTDPGKPDVRIEVLDGIEGGPKRGEIVERLPAEPNGGLEARPEFDVGDEVIVNISTDPEAGFVAVNDRYRVPTLAMLLVLFALAVTLVGGWRGRALADRARAHPRGHRQGRRAAHPRRVGSRLGRDPGGDRR